MPFLRPPSGLVKTGQVCAPFQDRRVKLNVDFFEKLLGVLHVGLTVGLRPLDRVEFRARSFPKLVEHEFIQPLGSFVNNCLDEFRFLRTTIKDASYLDKKRLFLIGLDMVMDAQRGRCSLCHMFPFQMFRQRTCARLLRSSATNRSGCSNAAKSPPWATTFQ